MVNLPVCTQFPSLLLIPITEDSFLSLLGLWHLIPGSPCPWGCPSHPIYALTSGAGPPISLPDCPPHPRGLHHLTILPLSLYELWHPTLGYCGPSFSSAYGYLPNGFRIELFKNRRKGEGEEKDLWLYFILTKIFYSFWPQWKYTTQIKV